MKRLISLFLCFSLILSFTNFSAGFYSFADSSPEILVGDLLTATPSNTQKATPSEVENIKDMAPELSTPSEAKKVIVEFEGYDPYGYEPLQTITLEEDKKDTLKLPEIIRVRLSDNTKFINLPVTWECDDNYSDTEYETYTFNMQLPDKYVLEEQLQANVSAFQASLPWIQVNIWLFNNNARGVSIFDQKISMLRNKFPHGKYWNHIGGTNNPDGYTNIPCDHHFSTGCSYSENGCDCNSFLGAIQCLGFAYKLGNEVFGTNPRDWYRGDDINKVVVGDIIRFYDVGEHSAMVIAIDSNDSDILYLGEANLYNKCFISWNRKIRRSKTSLINYLHATNYEDVFSGITYMPDGAIDNPNEEQLVKKSMTIQGWAGCGESNYDLNFYFDYEDAAHAIKWIPKEELYWREDIGFNGGFSFQQDISYLTEGEHTLILRIYNLDNNNVKLVKRKFIVENQDTIKPTISNVKVINVNRDGYTVLCDVSDDDAVAKVLFPSWTELNGQDDLQTPWSMGSIYSENTYSFRVEVHDHNFEYGKYRTDIYAYDKAGNYSVYSLSVNMPRPFSGEDDGWPITNTPASFGYIDHYKISANTYKELYGFDFGYSISAISGGIDWGGSCFGMAVLASKYYSDNGEPLNAVLPNHGDQRLGYRGYERIATDKNGSQYYTMSGNPEAIKLIEKAQISQLSKEVKATEVYKNDTRYTEFLKLLINGYEGTDVRYNPFVIGIQYRGEKGIVGHTLVVKSDVVPWDCGNNCVGIAVYDPNSQYRSTGTQCYLKLNTKNGEWEYYRDGINQGGSTRHALVIMDMKKLNSNFLNKKLTRDSLSGQKYGALIASENMILENTKGEIILKIQDGEVIYQSDKATFTIMYGDTDNEDGKIRGYLAYNDDYIESEMTNTDILFLGTDYYAILSQHGRGEADLNIKLGDIQVKNTDSGQVDIALQTASDNYKAVKYQSANSTNDYVKISLDKNGTVGFDTNKDIVDSFNIESNGKNKNITGISPNEINNKNIEDLFELSTATIKLPITSIVIEEGESYKLNVTIISDNDSDNELLWSSSSDVVVISNDGTILGYKKGEATITVRLKNNSNIYATCLVTVKEPAGSSTGGGGSSHSSGGGGSSSGGAGKKSVSSKPVSLPDYVVKGIWSLTSDGMWRFVDEGGNTYINKWGAIINPYANTIIGQSPFDWFYFDANGNMATGWHQEGENLFYLNQNSDGTRGRMVTGWFWIPDQNGVQRCYYFNPNSDGARGKLIRNSVIDGNTVNANGEWVVNGIVQTK